MGELLESLRVLPSVITRLRRPTLTSLGRRTHGLCHACGARGAFAFADIVPPVLAEDWGLTPSMKAAIDRRESGVCGVCENPYRGRQIARALVALYGRRGETSLADLVGGERFAAMRILGMDLPFLRVLEKCPGFSASDYITSLVPARRRPDHGLPFADASLDLVLASDTLEHIPAYRRVLREIGRVLVPGGRFVTIQPVVLARKTVTRCVVDDAGTVRHLRPPSYHCRQSDDSLVFVEFGIDFLDELDAAGLAATVYFYNLPADDYTWVAVGEKRRR